MPIQFEIIELQANSIQIMYYDRISHQLNSKYNKISDQGVFPKIQRYS